jgi:hypothetical protein
LTIITVSADVTVLMLLPKVLSVEVATAKPRLSIPSFMTSLISLVAAWR